MLLKFAIFIIVGLVIFYFIKLNEKIDKYFYEVNDIDYNLLIFNKYKYNILSEVKKVTKNEWIEWPEKSLYDTNKNWNIFPFFAFDIWIHKNCSMCPNICYLLKQIKGLKLATLSRLSKKMTLNKHQGWASHSNNVIRCHFGIIVPEKCYIGVENNNHTEIKYHKQFEWLIFDDSKIHYASNESDSDRIVLIIDIERPKNIKKGESEIGDTKELLDIVKYFKNNN